MADFIPDSVDLTLHLRVSPAPGLISRELDREALADLIASVLTEQSAGATYRNLGGTMVLYSPVPPKSVGIRAGEYHGKPGFHVYTIGQDRNRRVFTLTRGSAEKIKARWLAGEQDRDEDWHDD